MKTCQECPDRVRCVRLCPEMEAKAAVDHVRLREFNLCVEGIKAAVVTWQDVQSAAYTDLPLYPFLSDLENKLLHDYWYRRKSYAQIAMMRGLSASAVKARLARIYAKLRTQEHKVLRGQNSSRRARQWR